MKNRNRSAVTATLTLASIVMASIAPAAFAQGSGAPARIRGDIVSATSDALTVHRRSGDTVAIGLKPAQPVLTVKPMALADIKPGSYVGIASKTGVDGKMTALEVVVFPEAARGTGEGHYGWDLGANSTMTNANVDTVVTGTSGRDLKLSYKGGSSQITVPPTVPVVTLVPALPADLVAGKKVFVIAAPGSDGKLEARNVVVEKDGVVPPM